MGSYKKIKSGISKNEMKITPTYSKKEMEGRIITGVKIEIDGKKIILDNEQSKDIVYYLIRLS